MPQRQNRITDPKKFASLSELLHSDPSVGTWEIEHNGLKVHAYYDWRDADTTLVTFTGSVNAKVTTVPVWSAFGATSGIGVNRLFISDPTLAITQRLRLGWYAGNKLHPALEDEVTQLIQYAARGTRVVLFGPSAGGYTALVQGSRLPGSTVIASNPQTDITIRPAFPKYLELAWGVNDHTGLLFTKNVVDVYRNPVDTQVVYVQNLGDTHHIEYHQNPFLNAVHPDNRVHVLHPDLGDGHVGPDAESFNRLFTTVCGISEWADLVSAIQTIDLTNIPKQK